ncbi:MAG: restriction endonuclease subunit S [Xanthomonadaceae bacterium]|nr:restriction endonuclease subunit S [Xanthomonadaceae bacterium]
MSELAVGDSTELPASWNVAAIDEVASINPKLAEAIDDSDHVHFVPMAAVAEDFGGIDVSATRPYGEVRKGYTYFASQDVLFAKITPCMENGKGALVPELAHIHAFGSTEFHVLRSYGAVRPKWLACFLSQPDFRKAARHNMMGTAGQLRVPTKWLSTSKLPVPPLAEQDRVLEKLEELLSDLDAGVAELKAAQRKLAQYRQSLLKAAVEGALTADWRAVRLDNAKPTSSSSPRKRGSSASVASKSLDSRFRGNDEQGGSGADLLQRILTERRARWEAKQLAKYAEQGKTPPKGWQAKYPEPDVPDLANQPPLPKGWAWASVEQLGEVQLGRQRSPDKLKGDNPTPYIRAANITEIGVDLTDVLEMDFSPTERETFALKRGDILLTEASGSAEHVGRPAIWTQDHGLYCFQNTVLRFTPNTISAEFGFFSFLAMQKLGVFSRLSGGVGINHLSAGKFSKLPIALPPITEQQAVVDTLRGCLSACDQQNLAIETSLKQAAAQRKNILKAAFAGQLIPQDPNDEPASALLERIRAVQVAKAVTGRGKTGQKRKEKS